MILTLFSLFTGRKIVYLLDFEGEVFRTIESSNVNPFTGLKYCYVYWFAKVGLVNLKDGGAVSGRPYIVKWIYEKPVENS